MKRRSPSWCLVLALVLAGCERTPDPGPPAPEPETEAKARKTDPAPEPEAKAPDPAPEAEEPEPPPGIALSFDDDAVGGPAAGIEAVVGDWLVAEENGARGLMVDGSRWRSGTPSVSIVDQARRLYGERYAEFLDGVKAFAFYPLAVAEKEPPAGDLRLSVRFYAISGKVDQAAGIAFDIKPDGSYAAVRANSLEDNIMWFRVKKGKRKIIDMIRNTPTPTRTWHTLTLLLRGTEMDVELDGKNYFHKTLEAAPSGRVGLWSKADSRVLMDDFRVEPL